MNLGEIYLKELEEEVVASRKCLERIKPELFKYKPHEKSMELGYLCVIVADIPKWISLTIDKGLIDFATFERWYPESTEDLIKHLDANMEGARKALKNISDEDLKAKFDLKNNGVLLISDTKEHSVSSSINHWVHHRGQLTVYMRLNNIAVPSIYGPSGDDKTF
ncbi:MAG: damage-inducible protein DinB [Candidatus Doudnabacteria bacterium]|nr:damage-inducible protein DinB [Candidatus Doudnabacteria bacterium]